MSYGQVGIQQTLCLTRMCPEAHTCQHWNGKGRPTSGVTRNTSSSPGLACRTTSSQSQATAETATRTGSVCYMKDSRWGHRHEDPSVSQEGSVSVNMEAGPLLMEQQSSEITL